MKKIYLLLILALFSTNLVAQNGKDVLIWAEKMPEFKGGDFALRKYVADHIRYPDILGEVDIRGTVYLRFVVTETGLVTNIEVTKGLDPVLDEEAVRVVKSLPNNFIAGEQNGKKVSVWYSLPVVFDY